MKKFIITLFALITSFTANAKEYNKNETKDCSQNAIVMLCDLEGEPITGVVKSYYDNGNLKLEGNFKDGKYEGLGKGYYENGNLKVEGNFKDGKEEGLEKRYYENGNLKGEINYKDGKAVSGYMYDIDGEKKEMTNAHLHNMTKNLK